MELTATILDGTGATSAATLTPDINLTDEFGNTFPAFTTTTASQF